MHLTVALSGSQASRLLHRAAIHNLCGIDMEQVSYASSFYLLVLCLLCQLISESWERCFNAHESNALPEGSSLRKPAVAAGCPAMGPEGAEARGRDYSPPQSTLLRTCMSSAPINSEDDGNM